MPAVTKSVVGRPQHKVAIVAIHGVINHARYEIQDKVAEKLSEELPSPPADSWVCDVVPSPDITLPPTPPPTITRVHLRSDNARSPGGDFFDVIEAYWSPVDKGKTTAASVLLWLLSTVFVPINNTARYVASTQKRVFDIAYVSALLFLALLALVGTFVLSFLAVVKITALGGAAHGNFGDVIRAISQPASLLSLFTPLAIVYIVLGAAGGYLLMQGVRAGYSLTKNWRALGTVPVQRLSRIRATLLLVVVGAGLLIISAVVPVGGQAMGVWAVFFVGAAGSLRMLQSLLRWFLVAFFGDVQIYTTRDENADFFKLREQILEVVAKTIADVAQASDGGQKRYDRVIIMAHSLGSTVAMDALIRLYNAQIADPNFRSAYASIRAFVSFGTSLEKTKYFFDAAKPTLSQSFEQWRNDAYGVIFTDDPSVLIHANSVNGGIFWANYWYEQDPVCNEIVTYRSFLVPGDSLSQSSQIRATVAAVAKPADSSIVGREICRNEKGSQRMALYPFDRICIHGAYLDDPWLWRNRWDWVGPRLDVGLHLGVMTIIMARDFVRHGFTRYTAAAEAAVKEAHAERFVTKPSKLVMDLRDKY